MRLRVSTTCTLSLAVALTLGAATAGSAQIDTTRARSDTTGRAAMRDTTQTGRRMRQRAGMRDTSMRDTSAMRRRTARSTQRIPVHKEPGTAFRPDTGRTNVISGGEVAPSRVDSSAMMMRRDSMEMMRRDSIEAARRDSAAMAAPRDTATMRRDTAMAVPAPTPPPTPPPAPDTSFRGRPTQTGMAGMHNLFGTSGFYIGVGGGAAIPISKFKDMGYKTGYDISVPIGWSPYRSPLGIRLDLTYNQMSAKANSNVPGATPGVSFSTEDPRVLGASLDLTLKFPIRDASGDERFAFYVLGGGGVHNFRHFAQISTLSATLGNNISTSSGKDNVTKGSVNAGGGISVGFGPAALFVESRWVNVFTKKNDAISSFGGPTGLSTSNLQWVPIIAGVQIR